MGERFQVGSFSGFSLALETGLTKLSVCFARSLSIAKAGFPPKRIDYELDYAFLLLLDEIRVGLKDT